ncbi:hypothetical protein HmaOT1_01085 (plasmid) [Haematobacter massiliensis]|nr:hypothetical protein HmaOT1_01085 [Haematobacter massiliensis]
MDDQDRPTSRALRFPSAFTILFGLIILVAAMTWIVPAGQYERIHSEALDRDVPVAGTYAAVEANPQGITDVLMAPIAGLYDLRRDMQRVALRGQEQCAKSDVIADKTL